MTSLPQEPYGLYHPDYEHDSCGVGMVAHIKGVASRSILDDGLRTPPRVWSIEQALARSQTVEMARAF